MNGFSEPLAPELGSEAENYSAAVPEAAAPPSLWQALASAQRLDLAAVLTVPAVFGVICAWWATGLTPWLEIGFFAVATFCAALGYQALAAVTDFECSRTADIPAAEDLPGTPFALLTNGDLPIGLLLSSGLLALTIAGLSTLWLALLAGWPVLFFSILGGLIMLGAVLPPVRFAQRGLGIGELALTLVFAVLPLVAGYYIGARSLSWLPIAAGLPLCVLVFLIFFSQNQATARRDWLLGIRTLPVLLGSARAFDLSVVLTVAAYALILVDVIVARLPIWLLAGLATLPLVMGALAGMVRTDVTAEEGYRLRSAVSKAVIWTALLLSAALLISPAH